MNPAAFLQLPETQRALELAHKSAAMPMALHAMDGPREGLRVRGWGGCEVCRHIASLPGGRAACRASRSAHSALAMQQQRAIGFVCHAGLSCLSMPAWPGAPIALTVGPFAPEGHDGALEDAVAEAIALLTGGGLFSTAAPLHDLRRVPPEAPAAVGEWLRETLHALWQRHEHHIAPPAPETMAQPTPPAPSPPAPARRRQPHPEAAFPAQTVALLLMSANRSQAWRILEEAIAQHGADGAGARALALAAMVVDAAQRAGANTSRVREALAAAAPRLGDAGTSPQEARRILVLALGHLAPRRRAGVPDSELAALNTYIAPRLRDGLTLQEAARTLGVPESTLTLRLQKRFGLSFTEYVGRLRVEEAKRLLRRTSLSATEIARRVGIGEQSYFSKVFKRHTGLTPTEFRARYRQE